MPRIRRLKHVRFEQKGTKEAKGKKEEAITGQVPTAFPIVTLPSVTEPDAAQSVILNRLGA